MGAIQITFEVPSGFLDERGERAGFVLLAAFLLSFLFIRTSARLIRSPKVSWWPGSVKTGSGLHLHHLVWGIVLMMVSGLIEFAAAPDTPWNEVLAGLFGVGMGLTLDEFALWIYLRDVYWADEGRSSLDAVVVAAAIGGLIVLGVAPFDLPNGSASVTTIVASVLVAVGLAAIVIFKGKPFMGLIGIFIPPVSILGILRLAAPSSPWSRRFYDPDSRKLERSRTRYARIGARRQRLSNAIAGAPSAASAKAGAHQQAADDASGPP